ncbi:MAG: arylesterase [Rhizobiales bacterium PAR1]|nr:MAG: arylesterase [Rhizobiales bacterium PAR1]
MSRRRALALFVAGGSLMAGAKTSLAAKTIRMVVLGDSLSAGYLLGAGDAFPAVLEAALKARGHDIVIENAGVSGDTATGGLERLDWSVAEGTDMVIVELGANDALRGIDTKITEAALDQILARLKARNIHVLLAGMYAPRNNGEVYTRAFDAIYPRLAQKHGVPLYPFFLDGIQGEATLNLADGMHPNPKGVRVIVERILPAVEALIRAPRAAT